MNYGIKVVDPLNDGKDAYITGFRSYGVDKVTFKILFQEEFYPLTTDEAAATMLLELFDFGLEYAVMYVMDETTATTDRIAFLEQEIAFAQAAEAYRQAQLDALTGP